VLGGIYVTRYSHLFHKDSFSIPNYFTIGIQNPALENQKPFTIQLKNFGAFHNKNNPVIYVKPTVTKELQFLQKERMILP